MNGRSRRADTGSSRIAAMLGIGVVVASIGFHDLLDAKTLSAAGLKRDGRSLTWNDKPIHLVGYSYYGLLGDRRFDADAFLQVLAAHNINFTRFFLILPWPVEPGASNLLPFAKSGGKYDLRKFNDAYFARLQSIVARAEKLDIVCQVCLFDRCGLSISDRRAWRNNPYNGDRNINGLFDGGDGGYPPFCYAKGPIAAINSTFIKKVVESIGDHRNVIYEIMNEPYGQLGPLPQWHAWVARQLRKDLKNRPGSKVISSSGAFDDEEIDLFSMHTASDDQSVAAAVHRSAQLNKPVILSDDGDKDSMFNPEATRSAAERALQLGQHFEHLAYTMTLQREQEHLPAARLDEMPGLCRRNLRTLSSLSRPLSARSFVRRALLRNSEAGYILSAKIEHIEQSLRVIGQRSQDGGRTWVPLAVTVDQSGNVTSAPLLPRKGAVNFARIVIIGKASHRRPGPAVEFGPPNAWSVRLSQKVVEAGLFRVRPYIPDGALRRVRRGGQVCWEIDPHRRGKYAYFRLDDSFPRGNAGGKVSVTIEFFDNSAGSRLVLEYDGSGSPYSRAEPVLLGGSGKWKSASFTLRDARFQGRQNDGADFRFSLDGSGRPLALRSVRLDVLRHSS